jgi:hypothetical protein
MWVNWVRSRKPLKLQQPILTRLSRPRKTAPRLAARCLGKQPLPGERRWDAQGCFPGVALRKGRRYNAFDLPICIQYGGRFLNSDDHLYKRQYPNLREGLPSSALTVRVRS